jgi:RHS repeat-associated protein
MMKKIFRFIFLLVCLSLALTLIPSPTMPTVSADSTVRIQNIWVSSSNYLYVRIDGVHDYYRLYVRKHGEVFGDPGRGYYQIYPGGTWPKDLLIVRYLEANTVYCIEIRSNDNAIQHAIASYKTGSSGPPYHGSTCLDGYCPADHTNNVRLMGSLTIDPSAPIEGQSTQATFGEVCNDGWNTVNLAQVYVGVNTGENWPDGGNQGALASCQCRTINYDQSRSFTAGWKYAAAGWHDGAWHEFGVRDPNSYNGRWFEVLAPADVRLRDGTSIALSHDQINPGTSVTAQFTAHNYGDVSTTENFRVAIYDETGANVVAAFPTSGNQTLAGGGEYSYSGSYQFDTSGKYWLRAQHYTDGSWVNLAGNASQPLRVYVPQPPQDPKVKGYAPACPKAGEPVNTATGNFTSHHTDWTRPGPGMSFNFRRFYNSIDADTMPGPLGYGWTHSYQYGFDWRIDDTVVITLTDGHIAYFVGDLGTQDDPDPGTYVADNGVLDTLVRDTQGTPGNWDDDTFVLTTPDQIHHYFDADQRLVRIEDRSGNTQYLSYDGDGRLIQIVDTANVTYTFAYSGGLITGITSSNGEGISYGYDRAGNLISFTNTAGEAMTYTYGEGLHYTYYTGYLMPCCDEHHRLLTGIDPSGRLFVQNIYDSEGRVIEQRDAEGIVSTFHYDALGQTTVYTDALGNPLTQVYDDRYRLIREIDALGHFITYTYDIDSNVVAMRDKNGNLTRYTYDERGNMLSKTDALGYVWTYTYDEQNNLLTETDPLGNTTTYEYDAQGRLVRKTDPEGGVQKYAYGAQGLVTWQEDETGSQTRYSYNDLGLPVTVTNALSQTTLLAYDALGRKLSFTDAEGNIVRYAYDAMGRTTVITAPDGGLTTFSYDLMGNLLTETDALGHIRVFAYDAYNRLATETDWAGNETGHEYDALGRLVTDMDPLGHTTVYTYDVVGNLVARQDKNGHVTTHTYDANGNRLTETDPLGHTTTYVYDALNRVVEAINPASCCGSSHRYTEYDAAGRVIRQTDALGHVTTLVYDKAGRLKSRTNPLGETTTYSYDAAGRLTVETDPLGQQTRYDYDALGQPIATTNRLGHATAQHYDAVGRVVETIDERGHVTTQAYDSADRLIQLTDPLGYTTTYTYDLLGNKLTETDALGHARTYTYDANGQLLTETDANGHTTSYAYDALGRMTRKTDPLGGVTRYEYDPNGNLLTETDPLGHKTTYQYDALGRKIEVIDAEGNETTYSYDDAGNLVSRTDAEGHTWRYEYNANNNLVAETDPQGRVTHYEYDALDRQVKVTDPLGGVSLTVYDELGRVAETTNAAGQRTGYTYDAEGHRIAQADALGFSWTYAYDPAGNQIRTVDRLEHTTAHAYDALNRQTAITDALGGVSAWEYDPLGRVITTTDQLGRQTTRVYDPAGNLITETNALSGTTVYGYDALNRQVSVTDTNGHTTLTHYDAAGRVLITTLPGGEISYTYDKVGHRLSQTDAAGRTTHWEYDGLGRMMREVDPLGNATEHEYDGVGNLTLERDALGRETRFAYDALNRPVEVTDAADHGTRYAYDPVGNLIRQEDANGHVTEFAYDARNQRIREVNPLRETWRYRYDAEGHQTSLEKPDGTIISYRYDALGRLVLTDYDDDTPDVTFTYDAVGDRLSMSDGTGTTTYTYDALDRMTGIAHPNGELVSYGYDGVGNRVRVTYPGGEQATYAFDADDHLQSVTTVEGVTTYTRDASGLPLRVDYPNGAYVAHDYDGAGRVVGVANGNADGTFATYAFTLDEGGNKTRKVETLVEGTSISVVTTTYTYDARDQLVDSVASDGVEAHYTFDAAGNRVGMAGVRQDESGLEPYTVDYTYNAANQLLSADDSVRGLTTYTYDANGARIVQQESERRVVYGYDAEDRLVHASVQVPGGSGAPFSFYLPLIMKGGVAASAGSAGSMPVTAGTVGWVALDGRAERYAYDGQSRRVRKQQVELSTGETLWERTYLYGRDWNVLQETTAPITVTRYIYDDAMQRLQTVVGGVPGYLHYDDLGSAVGYTHSDGALRDEDGLRRYGDYGDVMSGGASWWTDTAYTGHEREAHTGLYYARHRYYDPEVGVWLTLDDQRGDRDDPLSQHRYVYVQSNPVNQIDPLGLYLVQVGELELWRYCNDHHPGWKAYLKQGVATWLGDFGRDWAWRCQKYSWYPATWGAGINYNLACEEQHGPGAYAALASFDPYGIKCFKHVPDPPANQPKTQARGGIVSALQQIVSAALQRAAQISEVENKGLATSDCGEKGQGDCPVDKEEGGNGSSPEPPRRFNTVSEIAREAAQQWQAIPESERETLKHQDGHVCEKCPVVNGVTIYTRCDDCWWFVGSVFEARGDVSHNDCIGFKGYLSSIPDTDERVIWSGYREEDCNRPLTWAQLKPGDIHWHSTHAMLVLDNMEVAHTRCDIDPNGLVIERANDNVWHATGEGIRIVRLLGW